MIFVTVGEQLPFDRLIKAVDECASQLLQPVFAQIGAMKWRPRHIKYERFLDPLTYEQKFMEADLVVAHAGMGTIITAMELGKKLIVMPRRAEYQEHRNDHQVATAERFSSLGFMRVVHGEQELKALLLNPSAWQSTDGKRCNASTAQELLSAIADFVQNE